MLENIEYMRVEKHFENEDKKQLRVERTCIKFNIEIKGGTINMDL